MLDFRKEQTKFYDHESKLHAFQEQALSWGCLHPWHTKGIYQTLNPLPLTLCTGSRSSYEIVDMELAGQDHVTSSSNMLATSPTQMEFVTSVPTMDVSGLYSFSSSSTLLLLYSYFT